MPSGSTMWGTKKKSNQKVYITKKSMELKNTFSHTQQKQNSNPFDSWHYYFYLHVCLLYSIPFILPRVRFNGMPNIASRIYDEIKDELWKKKKWE